MRDRLWIPGMGSEWESDNGNGHLQGLFPHEHVGAFLIILIETIFRGGSDRRDNEGG
jgi:hypothetical protein